MSPRAAAAGPLAALLLALVAGPPAAAAPAPAASAPAVRAVEVEGTAFRLTLADGRVLRQEELPGTILSLGDGPAHRRLLRIDAVERDPRDPRGEVVLYALSTRDPATGAWRDLCGPDPDGRRLGFPLAGAAAPDGRHVESPGRFRVTCTAGAEGKCVRLGYKPWRRLPDGTSLAPHHQACVRLLRADYCGDGTGHTRDGTTVSIYDRVGIQADEPAPGMAFEAAWGPGGAVCVRRTRLPDVLAPDALAASCPRLAGRLGDACDEGAPALLYGRSHGR